MGGQQDTAVFVCTPELVNSWLFYPAWFCRRKVLPSRIVMDYRDASRCHQESSVLQATPYDYMVSETLKTYERYGFLVTTDPRYARMGPANPAQFDYATYVTDKDRKEMREVSQRILRRLSREQLQTILRDGCENWLSFGLMLKRKFKEKDSVFVQAIDRTRDEITQIKRNGWPIDPERLASRYFMKLLTGLKAADKYAEFAGISPSSTRVFDTPEYGLAAQWLSKYAGVPPERFAIPDSAPEQNEQVIMELLKIDEPFSPLCQQDFHLLLKAVDYTRMLISSEGERQTQNTLLRQAEQAKQALHRKEHLAGIVGVGTVAVSPVIAALFESNPSLCASLVALVDLVVYSLTAEKMLRHELNGMSEAAQFIALRETLHGWNPVYRARETCIRAFLRLARIVRPRPVTEERIARQMMDPWLKASVWYE